MAAEVRLIVEPDKKGHWHMARDSYFLKYKSENPDTPVILCIYTWKPHALSLGKFQKTKGINTSKLSELNLDIVRRPTGGRAVLHADEFTYSIVASTCDGVPFGVKKSYLYFQNILIGVLNYLNINPDREVNTRKNEASKSACFGITQISDLTLNGKKLVGSAQQWQKSTVLQHGSILKSFNFALHTAIFGQYQSKLLKKNAATLLRDAGKNVSLNEFVEGFKKLFQKNGYFVYPSRLTIKERKAIKRFIKDKNN